MSNLVTLDIHQRDPFADGHLFGDVGAYERLKGRAHFAVDPDADAQRSVVDLGLAPRNSAGLVEFSADILILKPVDMARSNRRIFFDYGNRANIRALQFFCDAPFSNDPSALAHAGNGYLFRHGYVVVWCAWQGDVRRGGGRFCLDVPTARNGDELVTGQVRTEFIIEQDGLDTLPVSGFASTNGHPPVSLDTTHAQLTRRLHPDDARTPVPATDWQFARVEQGPGMDGQGQERGLVPCDSSIHMPGGFQRGFIYELIYSAKDPRIMGLGFVAVRDFISFLRHADRDAGGSTNPLRERDAPPIERAYCWGRSQTGRLIREAIYQGFNADAQQRKVFDGALIHVSGGGRMVLNHRFSCGTDAAGQQFETHDKAADRFPFTYAQTRDHVTGQEDALLKRPDTDPLVMHTQTGTEYWQRRGSLAHTDSQGNDVPLPENVRLYVWSSTQHFADPAPTAAHSGALAHALNRAQTSPFFRALLATMDAWATDGTAPPLSRYPRRQDGTLVDAAAWRKGFPLIPGTFRPQNPAGLPVFDHGERVESGYLDQVPPARTGDAYTVLVPATDSDGIDLGGVKAPMVAAPLGTFTGWNIRGRTISGHGAMFWFAGSFMPFCDTQRERELTGDPRPSTEERYESVDAYVGAVRAHCEKLIEQRLLLAEDLPRILSQAARWFRPWTEVG
ncbi:MAG: alpha/beta hydrolase domain-containing protein [Pseudomonadota bacterium]